MMTTLALTTVGWGRTIQEMHGFEPHFVLPPDANMVNVKDLGAVGDGKTDDTAAFKKAIETAGPLPSTTTAITPAR